MPPEYDAAGMRFPFVQRTRRPCIAVWGTSFEKIADEAQLLAVHSIVRRLSPEAEIVMFPWREYHHPDFRTIPMGMPSRVLAALASSDALIVAGGPFIETVPQTLTTAVLFGTAKLSRCPILVYGVSVFPLAKRWSRTTYRTALERAELLVVREPAAVDELTALGVTRHVPVCADPRLLLDPAPGDVVERLLREEGIDPERPYVSVTTRHLHPDVPEWVKHTHGYHGEHVERSYAALASALAALAEHARIVIVPMHPEREDDVAVSELLARRMPAAARPTLLSRRFSVAETIGIIQRSELLVAGRLGSAIFAAATGTPLVGLAYEQRLLDLMGSLELGAHAHPWKEVERAALTESALHVHARSAALREELAPRVAALRAAAWDDARSLAPYLNGRRA